MTNTVYSDKAITFCEISTLLLSYVVPVKSKEISQNFVAFSEYMNFIHFLKYVNTYIYNIIVVFEIFPWYFDLSRSIGQSQNIWSIFPKIFMLCDYLKGLQG